MRLLVWFACLGVMGWGIASGSVKPDVHVLVITGSTDGYLSPCGCVKPMSGGIRRRVTAIRHMTIADKTTVIDNGGLVEGDQRQDQMKAEAVCEAMALVGVDAINYGLEEARFGSGMAASLDRLSKGALVASGLGPGPTTVARFKVSGPFLIGAVDPRREPLSAALSQPVEPIDQTVRALVAEAKQSDLVPILMTRGDLASAEALAKSHPDLSLIVSSAKSSPLVEPKRVGGTLIVTPGEHGKFVVKIEWDGSGFRSYSFVDLGPEYKNDDRAQEVFAAYLARVTAEDLISQMPRTETERFIGSARCVSCHAAEGRVWKSSLHAQALSTLEREGQDRDPECVYCHVVGQKSVHGFVDRKVTPNLTDVGCESCHGPGRPHSMNPPKNKMGPVGKEMCMTCHNSEHSPTFDFDSYWEKIKH